MTRGLALACVLMLVACRKPSAATPELAESKPVTSAAAVPREAASAAAPAPEPPKPATVEHILVPGDLTASVVRSATGKAPLTVFIGGVCSNTAAYLHTFPQAAQKQGGVVGIEGDQLCSPNFDAHYRTYSWDAGKLHGRIEAALAAAGLQEIPKEGITIVGYSQGASLAEQLTAKYPGRYARVVIIAAPTDPAPRSYVKTRSLVTMACSRDVTVRMKTAMSAVNKLGTPSTYLQMPDCTHGQVADAENIFGQSFDWLGSHERAVPEDAQPVRIAGTDR